MTPAQSSELARELMSLSDAEYAERKRRTDAVPVKFSALPPEPSPDAIRLVVDRVVGQAMDRVAAHLARRPSASTPRTTLAPQPTAQHERPIREAPRVQFAASADDDDGRFRAAGAAFGSSGDDGQADDENDTPAFRAILAPYVADLELYAAARNAVNEWRALRRSRAGVHLASMPVERYVQCHPAVMAARGDAEFRGR